MTDITCIVKPFRTYSNDLRPVTKQQVGSDMIYRTVVKTKSGMNKFNFHSDYWGSSYDYKQEHMDLMEMISPFIGKKIKIDELECKLVGILVDKQYNSISHTRLLVET